MILILPSQGVIFDCNFREDPPYYSCQLFRVELDAEGNENVLTEVRGTHLQGRSDEDVGFLWSSDAYPFQRIPINVANFFPNLLDIRFVGGNLTFVSANDLQQFPLLQILYIKHHQIETLDGNLFEHTPNIRITEFDFNQITSVGHGLLDGLPNLVRVNFLGNPCIDFRATTQAEIETLRTQLVQQCPPIITPDPPTTTASTPGDCPVRCSINEEVDELRSQVLAQERTIVEQGERLDELERRFNEIGSIPPM